MTLTKIAYIGGTDLDEAYRLSGRLDNDDKILKYIQTKAREKASEGKSSWLSALLSGAGVGGGVGALIGAPGGGQVALATGLAGAVMGTVVGALLKLNDDMSIEEAQRIAGKLTPEQALEIVAKARRAASFDDIRMNAHEHAMWNATYKKLTE